MSDQKDVIDGLSKAQRGILSAPDLEATVRTANPSTMKALERKSLVNWKGVTDWKLTDLGTDVRNALLGNTELQSGEMPQADFDKVFERLAAIPTYDQLQACGHTAAGFKILAAECTAEAEPVNARGLGVDDLILDEVLARQVMMGADDDVLGIALVFNERLILEAALNASASAVEGLIDDASEFTLKASRMDALFKAQWKTETAMPAETCFRMVFPENANERWPDCPKGLRVWFTVFAQVIMALKPLAEAERKDLEARVDELKRMAWSEKQRKRKAAQVRAKEKARRERPEKIRKMLDEKYGEERT